MARRRRRRWLVWALALTGAWLLVRLLRDTAPVEASVPEGADAAPAAPIAAERPLPHPRAQARAVRPRRRGSAGVRPAVVAGVAMVMLIAGVAAALGVRGVGSGDTAPAPLWSLGLGASAGPSSAARWAPVVRVTAAMARPGAGTARLGTVAVATPEGAPNIVEMADAAPVRGRRWVRVQLAGDPGTSLGWVRRSALGPIRTVHTHLFVDLTARRLTLVRRGRVVLQAPAGVGTAAAPTPVGDFYVRSRLTRYASAFYGPVAFGLSARSPSLTDWPVAGSIGIHGTNRPQLVPGSVSRGSIRLRNPDVRRLADLLPLGTPVTIR